MVEGLGKYVFYDKANEISLLSTVVCLVAVQSTFLGDYIVYP